MEDSVSLSVVPSRSGVSRVSLVENILSGLLYSKRSVIRYWWVHSLGRSLHSTNLFWIRGCGALHFRWLCGWLADWFGSIQLVLVWFVHVELWHSVLRWFLFYFTGCTSQPDHSPNLLRIALAIRSFCNSSDELSTERWRRSSETERRVYWWNGSRIVGDGYCDSVWMDLLVLVGLARLASWLVAWLVEVYVLWSRVRMVGVCGRLSLGCIIGTHT
jgi:hypothetical protein